MSQNWNFIYNHKTKAIGLAFALVFIAIELISKLTVWVPHSYPLNSIFVILALSVAIFSKDKVDDERTAMVRSFALKQTFSILILSVPMASLFQFSQPVYVVIGTMLLYFPIYSLANYVNPEYVFKERLPQKSVIYLLIVFLLSSLFHIFF